MKGLFITATDTDVGKTVISGAIAAALTVRGINTGVVKPAASGGVVNKEGKLLAEDATFLLQAAQMGEERRQEVNPLCLAPALTPAVAAIESGVEIDTAMLVQACHAMLAKSDVTLIEGVGGIVAPIWEDYLVIDMMLELGLPAIIVTRPNLGTINHTVLTAEYAHNAGVRLGGIIVNCWDTEYSTILEISNLAYIERLTGLPIIGKFPKTPGINELPVKVEQLAELAEKHLDISYIMSLMDGGLIYE